MPLLQSYGLRGMEEMSHKYIDLTGACKICGRDHSPVTIELEHGRFIITPASAVPDLKLKKKIVHSNIVSPDIFWPTDEVDV
jgi:hypothetical protein